MWYNTPINKLPSAMLETSDGCMLNGVAHLMRKYTSQEAVAVFWSRVSIPKNINKCWEWENGKTPDGYGIFGYENEQRAHRVAWIFTNGEIPDGLFVLHECDNRGCCNPSHLFLGTNDDNMKDMARKGRSSKPVGEKNARCKISDEQVAEIRRLYLLGYTRQEIAPMFSISTGHVGKLVNRKHTMR